MSALSMTLTKHSRKLVFFFFALILLLGLFTTPSYGRPWDESDEMDILYMNLWEYARRFGLDESPFEARAARGGETISVLVPVSESIEQDHGAAAFYPLAGIMLDSRLTEHDRALCWRMYCWALFTLGAAALYGVCRELGLRPGVCLTTACMLLLSPRFFAEGHYNNKDVVLLSLTLLALWLALRLARKPGCLRGIAFALAGAFCCNTRVAGGALWALCALYVLLANLKNMTARVWRAAGATLAAFLGFYALLTPPMWHAPAAFFRYLVENAMSFQRWQNYVRFRGTTYLLIDQRLPWYYLPYMIVATTPLWALLAIAAGQLCALPGILSGKRPALSRLSLCLCTLLWLLPLAFALLTRTTVYNGWRHFYFLYGPMLALAGYGLERLLSLLERQGRTGRKRLLCGLLCACMALEGAGIAANHPYQYAYYQPLVRLLGQEDDLELDYWNVSVANALTRLAEQNPRELLSISPADLWAENGLRRTLPSLKPELAERFRITEEGGDFTLVNPTYALFSGWLPGEDEEEALSIRSYGQTILQIYRHTRAKEDDPA